MADARAPQDTGSDWIPADRRAVVLVLLVVAGCVDGIGLAELGHLFVSAMSGNTTTAGLRLAYRDVPGAVLPLGIVALFVAGVMIGTLVDDGAGRRAPALLLLAEAGLLALACAAYHGPRPMLGTALLPVAMGLANRVVARVSGMQPSVTYVTGILVRIGTGLARLGRGDARALAYDVAMWLAMLGGACAGGWGRLVYGTDTLLAPVGVLVVLVLATFARRR